MKKLLLLLLITNCFMFVGCENDTKPVENNISQSSSTESAEENIRTVETLGLNIKFTPNDTWIADIKYNELSDNNSEIYYYDSVAKTDCKMIISKNTPLSLPNYSFDQSKDQTWEATEKSITIKLQQAIEENVVVATWQYENYHFAIIGENIVFDNSNKESSIPKTAIYIINNLTKID